MAKVVAVAGAFDPLHIGHLEHLRAAMDLGEHLVVLLNPDSDLIRKKGFAFMAFAERREILLELRCVDEVREITDGDGTCARTLAWLDPDTFAKGGDRIETNMPQNELDVCREKGIEVVYGVGGGKIQSSSKLVRAARAKRR